MKKILSVVLAILLAISITPVLAEDVLLISANPKIIFSDVEANTEEGKAIYKLAEAGIILGDGDGTFRPDDPITRAELSKIVNMIFSYTDMDETGFNDVTAADWYYDYVLVAKKAGYIVGFQDGSFRGEENVSREQACTILCRVASLYDINLNFEITDEISDWAVPYVQKVLANAQMNLEEGNTFRATENITRAEFSVVFANYYIPSVEEPEYIVELKNTKGKITDAEIEIENGEISIILPDSVVLSTSSVITVTVKDTVGNLVADVKVIATDKNKVTVSATTDKSGIVKLKKESTGGGGGGGGGGNNNTDKEEPNYAEINSEALSKLKEVSKNITDNMSYFPKPYQYLFIEKVQEGIDKVIAKADKAVIDSDYVKEVCKSEIASAKGYFDTMLADENEKQKLQSSISSLHTDTIRWLIEYFDIDITAYI